MPAARLVVVQLYVAVLEYGCTIVQALDPGARIQNWYCGRGQPKAVAVKVTPVPTVCGEAGAADTVTDAHGWTVRV